MNRLLLVLACAALATVTACSDSQVASEEDAGGVDAAATGDSGRGPDANSSADSGSEREDAGTSDEDAGTSDEDAGTSDEDAGTSDEDAGTSDDDAGTEKPDGGSTTRPDAGPMCALDPRATCCFEDSDCRGIILPGRGVRCVNSSGCARNGEGVCKSPPADGRCWDDDDCAAGESCNGASVCGCELTCLIEDMPGRCTDRSDG